MREEIEELRAMTIDERLAIGPLLFREAMIVERLRVAFEDDNSESPSATV